MHICDISRNEFNKVYQRLGVQLEEKGESFYNSYILGVIEALSNQRIIKQDEGAYVVYVGKKCLIVVKSDDGYNCASTDLASLWLVTSMEFVNTNMMRYRLNEEQADWIVYVTNVGQQQHFDMVFNPNMQASFQLMMVCILKLAMSDLALFLEMMASAFKVGLWSGNNKEWTNEVLEKTAKEIGYEAKTHSQAVGGKSGLEEFDQSAEAIGCEVRTRSKAILDEHDVGKEWTKEELERVAKALIVKSRLVAIQYLLSMIGFQLLNVFSTGKNKKWTEEELDQIAEAIGYGAIKPSRWCWIILLNMHWGFIYYYLLRPLRRPTPISCRIYCVNICMTCQNIKQLLFRKSWYDPTVLKSHANHTTSLKLDFNSKAKSCYQFFEYLHVKKLFNYYVTCPVAASISLSSSKRQQCWTEILPIINLECWLEN